MVFQNAPTRIEGSEAPRRAAAKRGKDLGVAEALERVYEAGQDLLVRRLELLLEQGRSLLASTLAAQAGVLVALAGWALIVASVLQALDAGRPRLIGMIVAGVLHVAAGIAIAYAAMRSAKEHTQ
jgi:hypothetical protein